MNIQKLMSLSFNEHGVKTLLDLPIPIDEALSKAETSDLYALAEKFYELWVQVLFSPDEFSNIVQDENATWAKIVRLIGTYYDCILVLLLDRNYFKESGANIPAPYWGGLQKLLENKAVEFAELEESAIEKGIQLPKKVTDRIRAQTLFVTYIHFRQISLVYSYFKSVSHPAARFGEVTHLFLSLILQGVQSPILEEDQIAFLACQLLANALEYLEEIYEARAQSTPWIWNKDHQKGDFSSINLMELALLASRAPSMEVKYGEKAIEKRFETQVSLLMQTLGFYVIPTTPGSRTVDLICFPASASSEEAYTFLIEAKTSGHNYSLPTKDSRAIQEYIKDVKSNLRTFPPLKFILILGPNPTHTIKRKLQALESSVGIPVRYCRAQTLVNLRENLIGSVPAKVFHDQVLTGPPVLSDDFPSPIIDVYNDLQKSHIDYVRKLLSIAERFRM